MVRVSLAGVVVGSIFLLPGFFQRQLTKEVEKNEILVIIV